MISQEKKEKLKALLGDIDEQSDIYIGKFDEIKDKIKDIKIPDHNEELSVLSYEIKSLSEALDNYINQIFDRVDGVLSTIENSVPEAIDLSELIKKISLVSNQIKELPKPKEQDLSSLKPKDYSKNFDSLLMVMGELMRLVKENKKESDGIKRDLDEVKGRPIGGGAMYQDWGNDSTEDSTLSNPLADGQTFVLRSIPVNQVYFVYRNGVLENKNGITFQAPKTIFLNYPQQSGDIIQIQYPK